MIWNYVEMAGLVNLYVVFRNLVPPVITSGETTWGYWEVQVFRKLEHGPWHYKMTEIYIGTKKSNRLKCLKTYHSLYKTWSKEEHPIEHLRSDYGSEL